MIASLPKKIYREIRTFVAAVRDGLGYNFKALLKDVDTERNIDDISTVESATRFEITVPDDMVNAFVHFCCVNGQLFFGKISSSWAVFDPPDIWRFYFYYTGFSENAFNEIESVLRSIDIADCVVIHSMQVKTPDVPLRVKDITVYHQPRMFVTVNVKLSDGVSFRDFVGVLENRLPFWAMVERSDFERLMQSKLRENEVKIVFSSMLSYDVVSKIQQILRSD